MTFPPICIRLNKQRVGLRRSSSVPSPSHLTPDSGSWFPFVERLPDVTFSFASESPYVLPVSSVSVLITSSPSPNGPRRRSSATSVSRVFELERMALSAARAHRVRAARRHLSAPPNKGPSQLRRRGLFSPPTARRPFSFSFFTSPFFFLALFSTISSNSSRHLKCR